MRTAKCLTILLIVALACITPIGAGQGNAPQPPRGSSNTRSADCLVRITTDPDMIPLNMETVTAMLHSPAVLGKTAQEILGSDAPQGLQGLISIEWLPETGRSAGAQASESSGRQDSEMLRQLENIYGKQYAEMMQGTPNNKTDSTGGSQPDDGSVPKPESRQDRPGSNEKYGGAGGGSGMGGMVSGGYGSKGGGRRGPRMGGEGGGMMGGMGGGGFGGGMGGFYRGPTNSETDQAAEQGITIKLGVQLPDGVTPVAGEFLNALVENLRKSLAVADRKYAENLDGLLSFAESQRDMLLLRLQGTAVVLSADGQRIKEQLDTVVDLSALSPQMPFSEALQVLKNSVAPPLQVVALWNDLGKVNVEQTTPINIDGMPSVRLATALDLLLKGISPANPVVHRIKDSVVVIGTPVALQGSGEPATQSKEQIDVRALAAQKNELARTIQSLELGLVSMNARRDAIQRQMQITQEEARKRLAEDAVTQELERLVDMSKSNLDNLQKMVATGRLAQGELASAQESLARARIELARRREELGKLTSGGRLEQYNNELSEMTIDEADNRARLEVLHLQLAEVQKQLSQASTFDPEAARVRLAQEMLEIANRRLVEVQTRMANLQPPTVVTIGAN